MAVKETVESGLNRLRGEVRKGMAVPPDIDEKIKRGREKAKDKWASNDLALKFWRGDQYHFLASNGVLTAQGTVSNPDGTGKPRHRVRQAHNLIEPLVAAKVSAATRRVPSYEILPTGSDPEDAAAARIAAQVALYGYDKWSIRKATVGVVSYAVVAGEGFAWPYWDSTVGPFVDDGEGGHIGQGEVKIRVYGPNEVFWEPGVDFDNSPWHCVEQALPVDEIKNLEGYLGGEIVSDAASSDNPADDKDKNGKLALVRNYLERPSAKHPLGRWLTMANGKQIVTERPYPCAEYGIDGVCLHQLSYTHDPAEDHARGLVGHLIPSQRTYNDAMNKVSEWKNLALNPQVFVHTGALGGQRLTDEPGAVYEIPHPDQNVKWRDVPNVPRELFEICDRAEREMKAIAADSDIPSQVESSKSIAAVLEKDENRYYSFIADVAEFHSRVMRSCLALVQFHYTEPRLLGLKGRFGWESVPDFMGAQLRDQIDARVLPGSIEPRTKQAIENRILAFADRGWITPEAAMTAINGGTAEKLVEGYELEVAATNRDIQKLKAIENAAPEQMAELIPIAPIYCNPEVRLSVFTQWLTTEEAERSHPVVKEAADLYYQQLEQLKLQKQFQAQQMQMEQAQQYGMQHASQPAKPGSPSRPALQAGQDNLAA